MTTQEPQPVAETRLLNLTRLMNEKFDMRQSNLARAINRKPDYVWRVLNKQKGFGETLARDIERILVLPDRWLDDASNSTKLGAIPKAGSQIVIVRLLRNSDDVEDANEDGGMPIKVSTLNGYGVKFENTTMVVMEDNSMSMYIPKDEQVLIDKAATSPVDGKLFYVEHGRIRKIRRLSQESGGLWIMRCDTHDKVRYPDTTATEAELRVLGQVFWSAGGR